jgi:hypothetical protein
MRARHAIVVLVALMSVAGVQGQQNAGDDAAVMRALDAFIEGWNSRDAKQYAAVLHFPHVILEAGTPRLYPEEREFVARGSEFWSTVQPGPFCVTGLRSGCILTPIAPLAIRLGPHHHRHGAPRTLASRRDRGSELSVA